MRTKTNAMLGVAMLQGVLTGAPLQVRQYGWQESYGSYGVAQYRARRKKRNKAARRARRVNRMKQS